MFLQELNLFLVRFTSTTKALQVCLQVLAKNQELQSKLITDIKEKSQRSKTDNSSELLEATVLESFRLWPPVSFETLTCNKDCSISTKDGELFIFKKDDFIHLPFKLMQTDAVNFKSPENFDPHRFIDDPSKKSFLIRSSSTESFALHQAKILISKILSKYRIETLSLNSTNCRFVNLNKR